MSEEDKQYFVFNIVFPYINKKRKLELIIYNKYIQNHFNIDIKDYKLESGKYKLGEKNGFGKEYDFDD